MALKGTYLPGSTREPGTRACGQLWPEQQRGSSICWSSPQAGLQQWGLNSMQKKRIVRPKIHLDQESHPQGNSDYSWSWANASPHLSFSIWSRLCTKKHILLGESLIKMTFTPQQKRCLLSHSLSLVTPHPFLDCLGAQPYLPPLWSQARSLWLANHE